MNFSEKKIFRQIFSQPNAMIDVHWDLDSTGYITRLDFLTEENIDLSLIPKFARITSLLLRVGEDTDISFLEDMPKITDIDIIGIGPGPDTDTDTDTGIGTGIRGISTLTKLKHLKRLTLESCNLSDIAFLCPMTNLKSLDLNCNNITDISPLRYLNNLNRLNIGDNCFSDCSPLVKLTELISLSIWSNEISDISFIKDLTKLSFLNLEYNHIEDISILKANVRLRSLYLHNNQISNIDSLRNLHNLTMIGVSNNRISAIPKWILDSDKLSILWEDVTYGEKGINFFGNPFDDAAISVIKQGKSALRAYYKALESGVRYIYEAKLALLGEGEVGKTALTNRLTIPNYKLEKIPSTPGIKIRKEWSLDTDGLIDSTHFHFTLWDFGGQKKYDIAHTYFITPRSLYLLITDRRKDDNYTDFVRWLHVIQAYSENSPVIIVQNKIDERPDIMSIQPFKGHYDNIEDKLVCVSCADNRIDTIEQLKTAIRNAIPKLPQCKDKLPKSWVSVKEKLETVPETTYFITKKEYLDICQQQGINAETGLQVSKLLHDIGLIIHHQNDVILKDLVVTKTDWCIDAAYSVIDDNTIITNKGSFTFTDLERIWKDDKYQGKFNELILLMKYYRLCFELPDGKGFLIPILLPEDTPSDYDEPTRYTKRIYYKYPTQTPSGLMASIIVESHSCVYKEMYWKHGVVLQVNNTRAHIKEDPLSRKLKVGVEGIDPQGMLVIARHYIDSVHKRFQERSKNFTFEEKFPCICEVCSTRNDPTMYKKDDLYYRLECGKTTIDCSKNRCKAINIREILNGFEPLKEADCIYNYLYNTSKLLQNEIIELDMGGKEDNITNLYKVHKIKDDRIKMFVRPSYGLSEARKSSGVPDIVFAIDNIAISFAEAFRLTGWNSIEATKHWDKLFNYDIHGTFNNYILVYVKSPSFSGLWHTYCEYIQRHPFKYALDKWIDKSDQLDVSEIKIGTAFHVREEKTVMVTHMFIHIPQKVE